MLIPVPATIFGRKSPVSQSHLASLGGMIWLIFAFSHYKNYFLPYWGRPPKSRFTAKWPHPKSQCRIWKMEKWEKNEIGRNWNTKILTKNLNEGGRGTLTIFRGGPWKSKIRQLSCRGGKQPIRPGVFPPVWKQGATQWCRVWKKPWFLPITSIPIPKQVRFVVSMSSNANENPVSNRGKQSSRRFQDLLLAASKPGCFFCDL